MLTRRINCNRNDNLSNSDVSYDIYELHKINIILSFILFGH